MNTSILCYTVITSETLGNMHVSKHEICSFVTE